MEKYSIWIDVKNEAIDKQIKTLCKRYKAPYFDPHITLLGALKRERTEIVDLFDNWQPSFNCFSLQLGHIDASNTYFQCLFYKIMPHLDLLGLRKEAEQLFGKHYAYFPHLSLLYSDIPLKDRIQLTRSIAPLPIAIEIDSISLICTSRDIENWEVVSSKKLL